MAISGRTKIAIDFILIGSSFVAFGVLQLRYGSFEIANFDPNRAKEYANFVMGWLVVLGVQLVGFGCTYYEVQADLKALNIAYTVFTRLLFVSVMVLAIRSYRFFIQARA